MNDVVYADRAATRLFGLGPSDGATGLPIAAWLARIHPDDRQRVTANIGNVIAETGRFIETYRVERRDGGYRWLHAFGECVSSPDGKPLRYPGIMIDVSGGSRSESLGVVRIDWPDVVLDLVSAARDAARTMNDELLVDLLDLALRHLLKEDVNLPDGIETRARH